MSDRRTILVVDDDPGVLQSSVDLLTDVGYAVEGAASGEEALERLRENGAIGLVVTDNNMGGMSGVELLLELHSYPMTRGILMTGRLSPATAEEAQAAGAVAVLEKPFQVTELLGAIERALANSSPTA